MIFLLSGARKKCLALFFLTILSLLPAVGQALWSLDTPAQSCGAWNRTKIPRFRVWLPTFSRPRSFERDKLQATPYLPVEILMKSDHSCRQAIPENLDNYTLKYLLIAIALESEPSATPTPMSKIKIWPILSSKKYKISTSGKNDVIFGETK